MDAQLIESAIMQAQSNAKLPGWSNVYADAIPNK